MAIARNTSGGGNSGVASGTSITIALTIANNANRVLYVGIASASNADQTPTVTWNTTESLTQVSGAEIQGSTGNWLEVWYLVNPTATSANLSITGLSASTREAAYAVCWDGVDQSTPNDAVDLVQHAATSTTISSSTITSPSGDWIASFFGGEGSSALSATGGGNTMIAENNNGNIVRAAAGEDADGVDDTFDWSAAGSNSHMSLITFNLNAASTSGSSPGRLLTMLGVG